MNYVFYFGGIIAASALSVWAAQPESLGIAFLIGVFVGVVYSIIYLLTFGRNL